MTTGLSVNDVVGKLRSTVGASWKDEPWDGLQVGAMDAPVSGVAVVWAPGLALLKDAVARGCNLILCKDPVYWFEKEDPLKNPDTATSRIAEGVVGRTAWDIIDKTGIHRIKQEFITSNKLNIYRISENWDGGHQLATQGLLRMLGWKQADSFVADERFPNTRTVIVQIPTDDLGRVAEHAKKSVSSKATRLLGERSAKVTNIAVHPGFLTIPAATRIGKTPGLDVILTGETCEWEAFTYAEDWISSGHGKGFIMLGLAAASDAAAREVAEWVHQIVPSTKIEFLAAGDPFTPVYAGGLRA
jgi:putative NIF3 family GTP cyclohydrolase 1 type 2